MLERKQLPNAEEESFWACWWRRCLQSSAEERRAPEFLLEKKRAARCLRSREQLRCEICKPLDWSFSGQQLPLDTTSSVPSLCWDGFGYSPTPGRNSPCFTVCADVTFETESFILLSTAKEHNPRQENLGPFTTLHWQENALNTCAFVYICISLQWSAATPLNAALLTPKDAQSDLVFSNCVVWVSCPNFKTNI